MQYLIAFCSRPKTASDAISGADVEQVGVDVRVKFGDPTKSKQSRDIRLLHFVTDERR